MSDTTQLDRLIAEEPFVRTLAQSLLAGEADEVVQQTYMRALRHSGEDIQQPRSWLATVVRNVASNLQRDEKRRLQRERDAKAMSLAPSSDELMDREEQRQRLVAAIDSLPDQLRSVLLLRFYEGLAPRHIAQKTGLSNDIVRNRIRRALQLLRERLDQDNQGNRRAWMLALVPIACPTTAQTARATAAGLTATATTFAVLATAALLLWVSWPDNPPPSQIEVAEPTTDSMPALAAIPVPAGFSHTAPRSEVMSPSTSDTTTTLHVRVLHSDKKTPAAGIQLYVHQRRSDQRAPLSRQRCDEHGVASFVDVPPGKLWVSNDRGTKPLETFIEAGEAIGVTQVLDAGVTLIGQVVDESGNPMPFARIEGSPLRNHNADAHQMGIADASGHFKILDVSVRALVGARAAGHAAGTMLSVHGAKHSTVHLQLAVGPPACDVTGVVRDETGAPIPYASITIGGGRTSGLTVDGSVAPPLPSLAQSDENGRFVAHGVPAGNIHAVVVARGRAPWQGTCITHPDARNDLQISMLPGATIEGFVLQPDGEPSRNAMVKVHADHRFDHQEVLTAEDGYFRLTRLSPGTIELRVAGHGGGAIQQVAAKSGQVTQCILLLDDRPRHMPNHIARVEGDPNARIGQPPRNQGRRPLRSEGQPRGEPGHMADGDNRARRPDLAQTDRTPRRHIPERRRGRPGSPAQEPPTPPARRGKGTIRGLIITPEGVPIENASVFARRRDGLVAECLSSSNGKFLLDGMRRGTWQLDVFAHAMPPISIKEFKLGKGAEHQLPPITVPAGGRLRILLPLAYPEKAKIKLTPSPTLRRRPVHQVNGARETDFLPAGEYEMTVDNNGIELMREKVTVVAGKVTEVSYRSHKPR